MTKILVGSRAFFSGMKGFTSKDRDYLVLVDKPNGYTWRREQSMRGVCTFKYKKDTPAAMVAKTLEAGDPLLIGKFLVPAVADAIGATVEDILPLEILLPKLDTKHQYEAIIFNAIKNNGTFTLTYEQLQDAYKAYLDARMSQDNQPNKRNKNK